MATVSILSDEVRRQRVPLASNPATKAGVSVQKGQKGENDENSDIFGRCRTVGRHDRETSS